MQALLHALATFDHIADFGLELADFGRGFVELALRLIDMVAGVVMRLAQGLQSAFIVADVGHALFELIDDLEPFDTHAVLLGLGFGALEEPQLMLLERDLGVQAVVLGCDFGLFLKLVKIGIEFAKNVFHTGEVFGRGRKAVFRLTPALLVFGNPGCLFEEQTQLFRA